MPIVSLFPDTPQSRPSGQEDFEREGAARFGLFRTSSDLHWTLLWLFASYGDSRRRLIWTLLSLLF
jgi:hypothetical protein